MCRQCFPVEKLTLLPLHRLECVSRSRSERSAWAPIDSFCVPLSPQAFLNEIEIILGQTMFRPVGHGRDFS